MTHKHKTGRSSASVVSVDSVANFKYTILLLALLIALPAWAEEEPEVQLTPAQIEKRQKNLWQQAEDYLSQGNEAQAALYFNHYAKTYPEQPRASQALWQAASIYHQLAKNAAEPDYEKARSLYQRLIVNYPSSGHVAEAYLAVADTYFSSAYFREANNYYTLFLKDYGKHPAHDMARWKRAQSRIRINKLQKAREDYALLSLSSEKIFTLRGQAGLGHIYFAKGQWHNALGILLRIQHHNPEYHTYDPEILEAMGIASLRVGSANEGRRFLLHYINIGDQAKIQPAIYFELAESFMSEGQISPARQFYQQTINRGSGQQKEVILSHFRLAQLKAAKLETMSDSKRAAFIMKKGDRVFQTVLDDLYTNPVAQEARLILFDRYQERQEHDAALAMGKAYLRYKTTADKASRVELQLGKILLTKIEPLLADHKYSAIRALYEKEHKTITSYPRASLLTTIGTAFAAEGLYDQAAIIYYRAMALEMNEEEKQELYFKRAQVYLANNDLHAGQRLLKYLRQIYQDKQGISTVNWFSGQLREAQQRPDDALDFYRMAMEGKTITKDPNRAAIAQAYLRLLLEHDTTTCAKQLERCKKKQWLPPETIQQWYADLGDTLQMEKKTTNAMAAYRAALAVDLPETTSRAAQTSHLHLGDLLMTKNNPSEALAHFKKATDGPDQEISSQAKIRLEQARIKSAMGQVKGML